MAGERKRVHLICNAHLDPAWLWPWEEGLAEAVATFRVACDFCERVPGFVFCHNEAVLYKWVEDHDPELFERIRRFVRAGRWHVAGGSYLQPDLNMPSGESHIRHFLYGKNYFLDRFGVEPTTAYNFDSFGQPEGYVQILVGCGFDSYVFCRPDRSSMTLPVGPFRWRDRSGKEVIARRSADWYLTNQRAYECLTRWLPHYASEPETMILWGIGNHGGGPSREDLEQIERFAREHPEYDLVHSTPEAFFRQALHRRPSLPIVAGEMQNTFPGCYSSMSRIKRAHRACENLAAVTERLCALAWWTGRADWPEADLNAAWRDLLFGEFHDILPGSAIPMVERDSLALFGHCSEILRRTRARIFATLLRREPRAPEGVTPIFVWNPHGFPASCDMEFELMSTNVGGVPAGAAEVTVRDAEGAVVPSQKVQPAAPCAGDWRLRLAVPVRLRPFELRRFEVHWKRREQPKPWSTPELTGRFIDLACSTIRVTLDARTGLVASAGLASGRAMLARGALAPVVWPDLDHAWNCGDPDINARRPDPNMTGAPWGRPSGRFRLATEEETAAIISAPDSSGRHRRMERIAPIRIIEQGPVQTVVEAVFVLERSTIVRRYVFSEAQPWLEVCDRIFWNERDAVLKIAFPLAFRADATIAEAPYSAVRRLPSREHVEHVQQRWVAAVSESPSESAGASQAYVALLNDGVHSYSFYRNTLYLTLLRAPAYSSSDLSPALDAHRDRYWPRQDQGEHEIRYRVLFGERFDESDVSRAAQIMNVPPTWMVYFPAGEGGPPARRMSLSSL